MIILISLYISDNIFSIMIYKRHIIVYNEIIGGVFMKLLGNLLLIPMKILLFPLIVFIICFSILTSVLAFTGKFVLGFINIIILLGLAGSLYYGNTKIVVAFILLLSIGIISFIVELIPITLNKLSSSLINTLSFWF